MGLYAVTFVRMALPFEFGFTNTISDHSFYPVVIDALTPDKKKFLCARVYMAQPDFHNMDCGKCNPYYSGDIQVSQSNKNSEENGY